MGKNGTQAPPPSNLLAFSLSETGDRPHFRVMYSAADDAAFVHIHLHGSNAMTGKHKTHGYRSNLETRRSAVRRLEPLEHRSLLACDLVAMEFEWKTQNAGPEQIEIEYEAECERGVPDVEFEVEIKHAPPGSSHEVIVDGVTIGLVVIGDTGRGKLNLDSTPKDQGELPIPMDFPMIQPGSTIQVGSLTTLTVGQQGTKWDDDDDDDDDSQHSPNSCDADETKSKVVLAGAGSERGDVTLEVDCERGQLEHEFEVEIKNAIPGSTHDVLVDGTVVGSIVVNEKGKGKLELSSDPDSKNELPLPVDFPMIQPGSTVQVGSILAGTITTAWSYQPTDAAVAVAASDSAASNNVLEPPSADVAAATGILPGDVNGDSVVNSSDLVQLFQLGEYEDDLVDNSNWNTGDWNGDGEFSSADLVLLFQLGIYQAS
jgi:hypothetical protein